MHGRLLSLSPCHGDTLNTVGNKPDAAGDTLAVVMTGDILLDRGVRRVVARDGMDARAYGSQGQVRTCALSLKLSEIELMELQTGEAPVLMLDDVMSELDPERRRLLISRLEGVQTFVTCTDENDLAGAKIGKLLRVQNACILPEENP